MSRLWYMKEMLPHGHPYNQIFAQLLQQDLSQLRHATPMILQSQIDCFAQRSGRFGFLAIDLQMLRLWYMKEIEGVDPEEECKTLLAEADSELGPSHKTSLRIRWTIARSLIEKCEFMQAAEVAQSIIELVAQTKNESLLSDAFYCLSVADYRLANMEKAEQSIRHAIDIRARVYGCDDERVLSYLARYAIWLEGWGRLEDAANVHKRRKRFIDSRYDKLKREEDEEYQRFLAARGTGQVIPQ